MPDARRVVLLTSRDDVRAAVLPLAALAGTEVEVVASSGGLRAVWRSPAVLVVGSDLAAVTASARLPHRPAVVVVATDAPDDALWRSTIELGATGLLVMPGDERRLVDLLSDAAEEAPPGESTIAVIGGCGGAGASTLALGLALTSARAGLTALIDGDRFGGGLDVLLGIEQRPGMRWPDLAATRGRLGVAALTDALPWVDELAVLSWDRNGSVDLAVDAAAAVMNAAVRGFRSVVIDLPRRFDPGSTALVRSADVVVMLVPATVRGTAAAAMIAAELASECPQVQLVVRDAGAGRLTVGEVSGALGLQVIASLHSEPGVAVAAERGESPIRRGRGSLHDACCAVLAAVRTVEAAA
jgi:secretion/DNA translocation related CpaE-like protein